MAHLKLIVSEKDGLAHVRLDFNERVVGVMELPWHQYTDLTKLVVGKTREVVEKTIKDQLGQMIWTDALNTCGGDADRAKRLLEDLNWNTEKVDRYAKQLSQSFAQVVVELMPEIK